MRLTHAALAAAMMCAAPAAAQDWNKQERWCLGKDGATADRFGLASNRCASVGKLCTL